MNNDLITAVQKKDLDGVIRLVKAGADINQRDETGSTALHHAVCGRYPIAEFLLSKGADTEVVDDHGLTPLHVAFLRGDEVSCALLVNHGADTGKRMPDGRTPLAEVLEAQKMVVAPAGRHERGALNSGDRQPFVRLPFVRLPDILLMLLFAGATVLSAGDAEIAEAVCSSLSVWFVYEYYGAFFLMFWSAVNEHRQPASRPDRYRFVSTLAAGLGCALVMYYFFHLPVVTVLASAIGFAWPLLNPLMREDVPTAFQIGRETALGLVALIAGFIVVAFIAGIAEQILPRPFDRNFFDVVTIAAVGVVYYPLRWHLVARFAPPR